jgi:small subunit ribosomal protein S1
MDSSQPETELQETVEPEEKTAVAEDKDQPKRGDICEGTVLSLDETGAVIDLGVERPGFASVHDLNKLLPDQRDAVQAEAAVTVYVTEVDPEAEQIGVSIHQAIVNEDWIEAQKLKKERKIWEGKVVGYDQKGLIVPFGKLRGYVPLSQMVNIPRKANPNQIRERLGYYVGRTLPFRVIEADRRKRKLILSYRSAYSEWRERERQQFLNEIKEGDIRTGRVRELRDFGAFIDLGGGDGLIHISEFAWHRIEHPKEMLRVGEEVRVKVIKVNRKRKRVGLSLKRLTPHPWETVNERYEVNQLIEGKITRVTDFGAFVELEKGVEGLLHVKQLPRQAIPDPQKVVAEGEVHLLRITSIDSKKRRIRLSMRAVSLDEQMEWMAQRAERPVSDDSDAIGLADIVGEEE